ncbi:hypothetical protein IQ07DRAFT_9662 [Pyrenochaeta sp. DS3sAY3a]|nr:hypothetical protein IQ07DRAFT_9662 [Pyrenochaeta sp. DS3sAY3a]
MLLLSTFLASLYIEFASAQVISTTGRCGAAYGFTCTGSALGQCCSAAGWCGASSEYCGANCQPKFGTCGVASSSSAAPIPSIKAVSTDSRCGSKYNYQLCTGSPWGDCCSVFGYCGSTSDFCSFSRCQKDYGICTDSPTTLSSVTIGGGGSCASSSLTCPAVESILSTTTRTITSIASAPPPVTQTLSLTKIISRTETETLTEMVTPILDLGQPTGQLKLVAVTSLERVTILETSTLTKQAQTVTEATTVEVLSVNSVTVTSVSISISTTTSIKPAQTITTTATPLLDLGLAASLGVGLPPATTVTIISTATGAVLCPSGNPVANGG